MDYQTRAHAWTTLKDLVNELQCALHEAHRATMTEQPTSMQTKSNSTLNDILAAIEANANLIAANMKMIALRVEELGKDLTTGTGGNGG